MSNVEKQYRCQWEMDVEAASPREAAEKARGYQRHPDAMVGVFTVTERVSVQPEVWAEPVQIDVDEPGGG